MLRRFFKCLWNVNILEKLNINSEIKCWGFFMDFLKVVVEAEF